MHRRIIFYPFILMLTFVFSLNCQTNKTQIDDPVRSPKEIIRKMVDGVEREFIISTPQICMDGNADCPVVFMFHGGGGNGGKYYKISGWKELGETEGFISVFPSALNNCIEKEGIQETKTLWSNQKKIAQACDPALMKDDVVFVHFMIDFLTENRNIDANKIFSVGFSNGMEFVQDRLVPEMSNRFAGFGGAGKLLDTVYMVVDGIQPFYCMVGEQDKLMRSKNNDNDIPMTKIEFDSNPFMQSSLAHYLSMLGLDDSPMTRQTKKRLTMQYDESQNPLSSIFRISILKGVPHQWPNGGERTNGIDAPKLMWAFFKKYG